MIQFIKRLFFEKSDRTLNPDAGAIDAIMAAVSEAIVAIDSDGHPLFFNSQFAIQFLGKSVRPEQVKQVEVFQNLELAAGVEACLKFGRASKRELRLQVVGEPEPRHFLVSIGLLRAESSSESFGALLTFFDITELKRAEQIRIEFVGNVSHELKTPLTSIRGYTATVMDDVKSGRTEDLLAHLAIIDKNSNRLLDLVEDLLDLSSLESGVDLQISEFALRDCTQHALDSLENKRKAKWQEITLDCQVELLRADLRRVEQVIINLVDNAIKYGPVAGKIIVRWDLVEGGTRLQVVDNGPGIAKEHRDRLFERFYRIDKGRSRDSGGTGLGLAICKHIVQRHGGAIEVQSELGQGATFTCLFPNQPS